MIFDYLPSTDLQAGVGGELIQRLEVILPNLSPDDFDPTMIYQKDMLIKILNSFSPSQRLRNAEFRHTLLNSVPKDVLNEISQATGVGSVQDNFNVLVQKLVRKGWSDLDYCKSFIEATGLSKAFMPLKEKPLQYEELCPRSLWPYKRLKDYQYDVYRKAHEKLNIPRSRFVIQMPTGSGKTRTAMEIIAEFLNNSPTDAVVIWLAHSEELCEQCIECFRDVWQHIGERDIKLFRCWGDTPGLPSQAEETLFIVGGFQKLYNTLTNNPNDIMALNPRTRLLVVDEAHKVLAPTYQAVTMSLIGDDTKVVGLTATPGRSAYDADENVKLSEFFFNDMIGLEVPTNETVFSYLRNKEVLSRVIRQALQISTTHELNRRQIQYLEERFDFPPGFLQDLAKDDIRNLEIVKCLQEECAAGSRILFFGCSVEHSKFICALLVFFNINAAHLDGSTPRGERLHVISAFKSGEIQVLCNYGVLSTGFDAPKTDVVFIARPTSSIVLYSQMVGRGLRGPAIGGTAHCKVIDVIDNITNLPEANRIYGYFDEYWSA